MTVRSNAGVVYSAESTLRRPRELLAVLRRDLVASEAIIQHEGAFRVPKPVGWFVTDV